MAVFTKVDRLLVPMGPIGDFIGDEPTLAESTVIPALPIRIESIKKGAPVDKTLVELSLDDGGRFSGAHILRTGEVRGEFVELEQEVSREWRATSHESFTETQSRGEQVVERRTVSA